MKGTVLAVCISEKKGTKKHPVPSVILKEDHGIVGDAHAAGAPDSFERPAKEYRADENGNYTHLHNYHRQVSLLADESVDKMRSLGIELNAGDFAENILTRGIGLKSLPIGTRITIGEAELEVTQIGKQCHNDCEIKKLTGQCVMPTEGIFAVVVRGGEIKAGDVVITGV